MRCRFARPLCILSLMVLFAGPSLGQSMGEVDWKYELDLLGRELAEKHPDLFFKKDSAYFFGALQGLANYAPLKTRLGLAVELQQLMATMGDAQTLINYHFYIDKALILPLETYWFEEGIYVTKADRLYEKALGKKLIGINGHDLSVVIDSFSTLLVNENPSRRLYQVPRMLTWNQLLGHFGFSHADSVNLYLENAAGEKEVLTVHLPVSLGENLNLEPESVPLGRQDPKAYFRQVYFEEDQLLYIQYNRCWSREVEEEYGSGASALFMPSFREFEKEVFQLIKKKPVEKLVFDLRYNSGGHPRQGTDFIEKLRKARWKGQATPFLLVGRKTSKEALINAMDFLHDTDALVVGEESGGKPNHFGEVRRFVLPESGMIVSHSTRYFQLMEGDPRSIQPQVEAEESFELYMKGLDPSLEAVRQYPLP